MRQPIRSCQIAVLDRRFDWLARSHLSVLHIFATWIQNRYNDVFIVAQSLPVRCSLWGIVSLFPVSLVQLEMRFDVGNLDFCCFNF